MSQENSKTFYITTPIYYPSGDFHIGTAYTTIAADVMARYKRLTGHDVYFLTGMDEHGQKIAEKAAEVGKHPQDHVNEVAKKAKLLWEKLGITNDDFIQTTETRHKVLATKIFQRFVEQGDIYKDEYEGMYCTPCESYYTASQLNDNGCCPDCDRPVKAIKEESYFFNMKKYAARLIEYYEQNPEFIMPESRKTEMLSNFLIPGLTNLSVSRMTFDWGIKVPNDPEHVMYVWVDALTNYITALGYGSTDETLFDRYWPADVQIVGKDIIRFHTIYWPIFLMALDLPLPKLIFGHGFIMMRDGKMSKSKGNIVRPEMIAEKYGVDVLRYFLMREIPFGYDGVFSPATFAQRINSDLANDLGNLLNRTISMINKYFDGILPAEIQKATEFDQIHEEFFRTTRVSVEENFKKLAFNVILTDIWAFISRTNKYIDETTPWTLAKNDENLECLGSVMNRLATGLYRVAIMIRPFMPKTSDAVLTQLNLSKDVSWTDLDVNPFKDGHKVTDSPIPIFPRLDQEAEVEWMIEAMKNG